ncbi:MAG: phosphatidate cytidylyltransferase [Bacteroidales bacterium]|nr:phosphatidate cytidylyltransferase [Bacteroidales bacterium]
MKPFFKRSITGIIFVIAVVFSTWLHPLTFLFLISLLFVIGIIEFFRLFNSSKVQPQLILSILAGQSIIIGNYLFIEDFISSQFFFAFLLLPFLVFFAELFRSKELFTLNITASFTGIVYLSLPLSLLMYLGYQTGTGRSYDPELILGFFILLWLYDTGAYIVGSLAGRHIMLEKISPGKSWEGFFGGWIISTGTAYLLSIFFPVLSPMQWIIMATIIVISGTLGDMVESGMKRMAGVKDSGNLLPGHGGVLDRIDSVLLSVPFVYIYLKIIEIL